MWTKAYWKLNRAGRDNNFPRLPGIIPEQECLVRVRRNDWVQGLNQISRSYLEMFRQAHSHVIVLSAYFMPGSILRKQMAQAARRGVNHSDYRRRSLRREDGPPRRTIHVPLALRQPD